MSKMNKGINKCINFTWGISKSHNWIGCIEEEIRPVRLNMVAAGEHVGIIEHSNRTVKECTQCYIHRCLYERYPKVMVEGYVVKSAKDLNQLPSFNGISQNLRPSTLLTDDVRPDFNRINSLNFGNYVQVHRHNTPRNTYKARTIGIISLHLSRNDQGG